MLMKSLPACPVGQVTFLKVGLGLLLPPVKNLGASGDDVTNSEEKFMLKPLYFYIEQSFSS